MEGGSATSGIVPEKVTQAFVAPRSLQVLGVSPAQGRDFNADEEHFGGPYAVLISDRFWRRRFGADPKAIGKKLRMIGFSFSIVGIMPASFRFPDRDTDLWVPVPPDAPYAQSAGWGLAAAFTRLLSGMLYGISPTDVATFSAVVLIVFFVAGVASLVPAMRASSVEPMQVLREE